MAGMEGNLPVNTASLTALITAITALIGAAITLVTMIQHLKNHQDITSGKPAGKPAKPGLVNPPADGNWPR